MLRSPTRGGTQRGTGRRHADRMLPPRKISHSCSAGLLPTFSRLQVGGDGQVKAPPPARAPALHHGPVTIPHAGGLLRVWAEVRSGALHIYPQRAATLPSLVVGHLEACRVSLASLTPDPSSSSSASSSAGSSPFASFVAASSNVSVPAHCVTVHRQVREEVRLLLGTREEAEAWAGMLQVTAVSRSLQLEGLNLECGAADCSLPGVDGSAGEDDSLDDGPREDEDEGEGEGEDEDEEDRTEEALASLINLLQPFYCGDDVGSGSSCDMESPEEEDEEGDGGGGEGVDVEGGEGGVLEGDIPPPSPSSSLSSTTTVEGTEVRLRRPLRLSPDDDGGRRELLQQMLATKSLLEKKQRNRRSGAGAWAVTAGEVENEYDRAQYEAQQSALRKAVILRQRKNSTAIKMATLERQQSNKGKKQKQRKQRGKTETAGGSIITSNGGGGGGGSGSRKGRGKGGGGGVGGGRGGLVWDAIRELGVGVEVGDEDVSHQLETLRRRLSALDSELRESKQTTERTLQDLQQRREQELHLIKDLGGVAEDLSLVGGGAAGAGGLSEASLLKNNIGGGGGGSLMGSLSSIPSIVLSSSSNLSGGGEKKTSEKIFGIKKGGSSKEGRTKARNPLHFLDLKLRVSRRHKSTECLSERPAATHDRSHNSTPGNGSFSDNSSDEEGADSQHPQQQPQQQPQSPTATPQQQQMDGLGGVRTEVSVEALREIEAFKQLIHRYFATHPRHDSITAHAREILL
ncbi:uncharacterized protein LOC126982569 [Eriocheir sinensis]|uniref:uncharacterized protein LOC126982569 n=1 Tax=Eriocheir sinensis TaxID=95602 RepID=UPI0021C98EE4|nr:uncharacterized protein LOC126982569 [Eriocheir sinensis]